MLRVLAAYVMFTLTEYAVWIAMLVFAYSRGGAPIAGLVAVAQLVPAAVAAPVAAAVADRRSPVVLLAGGYLVQAAAMAGTAAAVGVGVPLATERRHRGDPVAQRVTAYGTHQGELLGVPATGRPVEFSVLQIVRAGPDGRFAEHWCSADLLSALRQLSTEVPALRRVV